MTNDAETRAYFRQVFRLASLFWAVTILIVAVLMVVLVDAPPTPTHPAVATVFDLPVEIAR